MKILKSGQYYGAKKQELDVESIRLSEYDYTAPATDWHYHENPYFMLVLSGQVNEINKKSKTPCPPGSLIFHNWQELHRNSKVSEHARGFHLELGKGWIEQVGFDLAPWQGSRILENPNCNLLLSQIYFEFKQADRYSNLAIELLLIQLMHVIDKNELENQHIPEWIDLLIQLLNDAPEDLSLASLSNTLGIHPAHISRAVPKYFGESLGTYIRKQKLKKATTYLFDSDYSLSEIAHLSGFSDHSHFTRTFRRYFGSTPRSVRNKIG